MSSLILRLSGLGLLFWPLLILAILFDPVVALLGLVAVEATIFTLSRFRADPAFFSPRR